MQNFLTPKSGHCPAERVSTPVHCPEFQEKTVRCAKNLKICRLGFHPGRNVKLGMLRAYSLLLAGRALRVQAKPLVLAETLTNVGWGFHPDNFFDEDKKLSFLCSYLRKTTPFGLSRIGRFSHCFEQLYGQAVLDLR